MIDEYVWGKIGMDIEKRIFGRSRVDFEKLVKYGFEKHVNSYSFSSDFMDGDFRAVVTVDEEGNTSGKVYDTQTGDEYSNIRVSIDDGAFVGEVRQAYENILKDIKNYCCNDKFFLSEQADRLTEYIIGKYGDSPEFLWKKFPGYGVFRNRDNKKWYAVIMNINGEKIGAASGETEILDIRVNEDSHGELLSRRGFYAGYHMNKKNWITVVLDDTIKDSEIEKLIDVSRLSVNLPKEWIVPANPKYYNIADCFNNTDTIDWKQSTDIRVGDVVYIYAASPYSAILYKCRAEKVNIPFTYKDKNISMERLMRLRLLKKYDKDDFTFSSLKALGINSIRGPRKISGKVIAELNK